MEAKELCSCGMPQSYPIPHEHDLTDREKRIRDASFKAVIEEVVKDLTKEMEEAEVGYKLGAVERCLSKWQAKPKVNPEHYTTQIEKIARHLFRKKYPPSNDALAYNLRWEDIPFDGCESSKPFYNSAEQILSFIEEDGYVKLAENQSLPLCPTQEVVGRHLFDFDRRKSLPYLQAQQDMREQGWRKVKEVKDG